jgi:hypothetical protein
MTSPGSKTCPLSVKKLLDTYLDKNEAFVSQHYNLRFGEMILSQLRGPTREKPEAYLYGTLRIASAENEEDGQKHPPKSEVYE